MACLINAGVQIGACRGGNQGGLKNIYLSTFSAATTFSENASEVITGTTGGTWYKFDLTKQTSSFTDKPTVNVENDTLFFNQEVELIINRMTPTLRNQMKALASSRVHIICEDNNGYFWLVGKDKGADLSDGTGQSGVKSDDRNGYSLKFLAQENSPVYNLTATFPSSY